MAVFEYTAIDGSGKTCKGIIDAESRKGARQKLRNKKLYPTAVAESRIEKNNKKRKKFNFNLQRINRAEFVYAIRQLATLLSAGLPLMQALTAVLEQIKNKPLHRIFSQVRERVKEGSSLAQAFEEHPNVFPSEFTAMINAGESSGTLEMVLERLAEFAEQQMALRRKVQATLAYPLLMLVVGLAVVFFLMSYVVPKVTQIFLDLDQALPVPTIMLIKVSHFFQAYWWILLLTLILFLFALQRYAQTSKGKAYYDRLLLSIPFIGEIIKNISISRFTRTLGTLLKNEVPLLTSLDIVRTVVANHVLAQAITKIKLQVSEGQNLVTPMSKSNIFPSTVVQMTAAGEQSGNLAEMLLMIAENFDNDVTNRLTVLTSLMEPVMILVLGTLVGFVVLAILLPIFEMSHLVQ